MKLECVPIYLEKKKEGMLGAWVHEDPILNRNVLTNACTSDIGILRLVVEDPETVMGILQSSGFVARKCLDTVEVVPDQRAGLSEILKICREREIDVELHSIIPGIYQG